MANSTHLKILHKGATTWNEWRRKQERVIPDLSGAKLKDLSLRYLDLSDAKLDRANLKRATLHHANFSRANLDGANFQDASLCFSRFVRTTFGNVRFPNADLSYVRIYRGSVRGADFGRAELTRALFLDCDLGDTNFAQSELLGTVFANVDLREARNLSQARFAGPFTIGIDTVIRSQGRIPARFLRGAGLPDILIESVLSRAITFNSCFISYSSKDRAFAERLHADLQSNGIRCWFAPEDLKIGDKTRRTIDESIRVHDRLLLILSVHSVASDWVEHEVETALAREQEKKRVTLFPIRLDNAVMEIKTGWPAHIKNTRHIGDFTRWKDRDAYQKSFARLLRDLKVSEAKKA
jgi:uncharacterized protein YjbI with pentapeptide repeats